MLLLRRVKCRYFITVMAWYLCLLKMVACTLLQSTQEMSGVPGDNRIRLSMCM